MKDQFFIKVYMVLMAVDPKQKGHSLFLFNFIHNEFPAKYLCKGEDPKVIAENLLMDHSGITSHWTILFPFGLIKNAFTDSLDELSLVYGAFIPEKVRPKIDGNQWISLDGVEDPFMKKIANEVIWKRGV